MISISYAITASTEVVELQRLLSTLVKFKRKEDEIILQLDRDNFDPIIMDIKEIKNKQIDLTHIVPLNRDFAAFKNSLKKYCSKDYIFFIDADECPTEYMLTILSDVIENNRVDVILVPRINTVVGITDEDIKKWKWNVNDKNWINYPDYQYRICKNIPEIFWKNKVHEVLDGHRSISYLPHNIHEFALIHEKTIGKQRKQNEFYNTLC